ncbi:MAG: acetate--CoA ligase family protein [Alphaproteobacteria bacterium]
MADKWIDLDSPRPLFQPRSIAILGGIFVEVLEDVTFCAAPFDVAEARRMIREIKSY